MFIPQKHANLLMGPGHSIHRQLGLDIPISYGKLRLFSESGQAINAYMYGTAKKKRPGYLVGNLVATNWPIEKALHAIGYNQIPTK